MAKAKATQDRHDRSNGQGQGMNWCRPATRLAVYLRDGLACCYCGATIEGGAKLTLDHLVPHTKGGSNAPSNLVTSCHKCNSSRGARTVRAFCQAVASYLDHGITPAQIERHVRRCVRRRLPRDEARALLARRGTVAAAIRGEKEES
jgi:hypothetical protein